MPIPPPPVPPIRVEFITQEPLWYAQWDFWVSVGTLIVDAMTGWYAWETRKLRKGSDRAMADLAKHAENVAASSKESAEAARRSAEALRAQVEVMGKAVAATVDPSGDIATPRFVAKRGECVSLLRLLPLDFVLRAVGLPWGSPRCERLFADFDLVFGGFEG